MTGIVLKSEGDDVQMDSAQCEMITDSFDKEIGFTIKTEDLTGHYLHENVCDQRDVTDTGHYDVARLLATMKTEMVCDQNDITNTGHFDDSKLDTMKTETICDQGDVMNTGHFNDSQLDTIKTEMVHGQSNIMDTGYFDDDSLLDAIKKETVSNQRDVTAQEHDSHTVTVKNENHQMPIGNQINRNVDYKQTPLQNRDLDNTQTPNQNRNLNNTQTPLQNRDLNTQTPLQNRDLDNRQAPLQIMSLGNPQLPLLVTNQCLQLVPLMGIRNQANSQVQLQDRNLANKQVQLQDSSLAHSQVQLQVRNLANNQVQLQVRNLANNQVQLQDRNLANNQVQLQDRNLSNNQVQLQDRNLANSQVPLQDSSLANNQVQLQVRNLANNQVQLQVRNLANNQVQLQDRNLANNQVQLQVRNLANNQVQLQDRNLANSQVPLPDSSLAKNQVQLQVRNLANNQVQLQDRNLDNNQVQLQDSSLAKNQVQLQDRNLANKQVQLQVRNLANSQVQLQDRNLANNQVQLQDRYLASNQVQLQVRNQATSQVPLQDRNLANSQVPLQMKNLGNEEVLLLVNNLGNRPVQFQMNSLNNIQVALQNRNQDKTQLLLQDRNQGKKQVSLQNRNLDKKQVSLKNKNHGKNESTIKNTNLDIRLMPPEKRCLTYSQNENIQKSTVDWSEKYMLVGEDIFLKGEWEIMMKKIDLTPGSLDQQGTRIHMTRFKYETQKGTFIWPYFGELNKCQCYMCGKIMSNINGSNLVPVQKHLMNHISSNKNLFKVSNKKYTESDQLLLHIKTHTGDGPYNCDICGHAFNELGQEWTPGYRNSQGQYVPYEEPNIKPRYKRNVEQKYKCEICNMSFLSLNGQKSHFRLSVMHKINMEKHIIGNETKNIEKSNSVGCKQVCLKNNGGQSVISVGSDSMVRQEKSQTYPKNVANNETEQHEITKSVISTGESDIVVSSLTSIENTGEHCMTTNSIRSDNTDGQQESYAHHQNLGNHDTEQQRMTKEIKTGESNSIVNSLTYFQDLGEECVATDTIRSDNIDRRQKSLAHHKNVGNNGTEQQGMTKEIINPGESNSTISNLASCQEHCVTTKSISSDIVDGQQKNEAHHQIVGSNSTDVKTLRSEGIDGQGTGKSHLWHPKQRFPFSIKSKGNHLLLQKNCFNLNRCHVGKKTTSSKRKERRLQNSHLKINQCHVDTRTITTKGKVLLQNKCLRKNWCPVHTGTRTITKKGKVLLQNSHLQKNRCRVDMKTIGSKVKEQVQNNHQKINPCPVDINRSNILTVKQNSKTSGLDPVQVNTKLETVNEHESSFWIVRPQTAEVLDGNSEIVNEHERAIGIPVVGLQSAQVLDGNSEITNVQQTFQSHVVDKQVAKQGIFKTTNIKGQQKSEIHLANVAQYDSGTDTLVTKSFDIPKSSLESPNTSEPSAGIDVISNVSRNIQKHVRNTRQHHFSRILKGNLSGERGLQNRSILEKVQEGNSNFEIRSKAAINVPEHRKSVSAISLENKDEQANIQTLSFSRGECNSDKSNGTIDSLDNADADLNTQRHSLHVDQQNLNLDDNIETETFIERNGRKVKLLNKETQRLQVETIRPTNNEEKTTPADVPGDLQLRSERLQTDMTRPSNNKEKITQADAPSDIQLRSERLHIDTTRPTNNLKKITLEDAPDDIQLKSERLHTDTTRPTNDGEKVKHTDVSSGTQHKSDINAEQQSDHSKTETNTKHKCYPEPTFELTLKKKCDTDLLAKVNASDAETMMSQLKIWTINGIMIWTFYGEQDWYKCGLCGKKQKSLAIFKSHVMCHINSKKYAGVGEEKYSELYRLHRHLMTHKKDDPDQCEVCGKAFNKLGQRYNAALSNQVPRQRQSNSETIKRPLYQCGKGVTCSKNLDSDPNKCQKKQTKGQDPAASPRRSNDASHLVVSLQKCDTGIGDKNKLQSPTKPCNMCNKTFSNQCLLDKHCKKCQKNNQQNPSPNSLSILIHKCDICHKTFGRRKNLKAHLKIHSGKKPHECSICQKKFIKRETLKTHLRKHTGERPYKCIICGKLSRYSSDRAKHMRTHTKQSPTCHVKERFLCEICGDRFICLKKLNKHLKKHLSAHTFTSQAFFQQMKVDKRINEPEDNLCEICGKVFNSKKTLWKHRNSHGKTYLCEICGKSLKTNYALKDHLRYIHTEEKPFHCEICYKGFKRKYHIKSHQRVHTAGRHRNCRYCGRAFIDPERLRRHQYTCM